MKTYTVLLLRPDYVADEFGKDTFMTHVEAGDVGSAEDTARLIAWHEDTYDGESEVDRADYAVLCVIEGKHMDIKTS